MLLQKPIVSLEPHTLRATLADDALDPSSLAVGSHCIISRLINPKSTFSDEQNHP